MVSQISNQNPTATASHLSETVNIYRSHKEWKVAPDGTAASFDVSVFFTRFHIPIALAVINREFTSHQN